MHNSLSSYCLTSYQSTNRLMTASSTEYNPSNYQRERSLKHTSSGFFCARLARPGTRNAHPLSLTEQRLSKAIAVDTELSPLFAFNVFVETVRGSRPKVDLLWKAGRLVIELDGYLDHGSRAAFMYDRHRDYELSLSGFTAFSRRTPRAAVRAVREVV